MSRGASSQKVTAHGFAGNGEAMPRRALNSKVTDLGRKQGRHKVREKKQDLRKGKEVARDLKIKIGVNANRKE
jgi:hypothetical protein